jgi:hypothetical protein
MVTIRCHGTVVPRWATLPSPTATGVAAVLHLAPHTLPALAPLERSSTDNADLLGALTWWPMRLRCSHPLPAGHYFCEIGFSAALYASSVRCRASA